MPHVGEQHADTGNANSRNPFEEQKPVVSDYTAKEIATLSSKLEKQLGPEYISSRPGAGGARVHYLSADKCINLANEVFGFNGWSSSIRQIDIDFVDENQITGKVSLGLSVIVRVALRDGTFHEDIGYGHIENCKGKAPAFEKAKKEGTTDGLKRALRNFGNLLGNCVYDKEYVAKVTRLKVAPTKFDPKNLHRHHDVASAKKEPSANDLHGQAEVKVEPRLERNESLEDEFGDDFDEVDFAVPEGDEPDDVVAGNRMESQHSKRRSSVPSNVRGSMGNRAEPEIQRSKQTGPQTPLAPTIPAQQNINNLSRVANSSAYLPSLNPPPAISNVQPSRPIRRDVAAQKTGPSSGNQPQTLNSSSSSSTHEPPIGFFTARDAETLLSAQPNSNVAASSFNPHLESPSIRKTAGIDHSKTKPINREIVGAPAIPAPMPMPMSRGINSNLTNPQVDKGRKVGMPGMASPLQNRGSYKPPQMKRPADGGSNIVRSALGDVTSASVNVAGGDGTVDAKRQRIGAENANGQVT